jgi:hypothetical protein
MGQNGAVLCTFHELQLYSRGYRARIADSSLSTNPVTGTHAFCTTLNIEHATHQGMCSSSQLHLVAVDTSFKIAFLFGEMGWQTRVCMMHFFIFILKHAHAHPFTWTLPPGGQPISTRERWPR